MIPRPLCPCNRCYAWRIYNAQQRKLTVVLSVVLAVALYVLYLTLKNQ